MAVDLSVAAVVSSVAPALLAIPAITFGLSGPLEAASVVVVHTAQWEGSVALAD